MSREIGDEFEKKILDLCDEIGILARTTKNSGAKFNDGDMYTCTIQGEAKHQGRKNPIIKLKEFAKIRKQAAHQNRVPVLFIENENGDSFAVVDLETFLRRYVANEETVGYGEEDFI